MIDSQLTVVGLQIGTAGLHEMAVGVGNVALAFPGRGAISFSRHTPAWHRICRQRFQFRWVDSRGLGSFDRLLFGGLGLGDCHLSLPVQFGLLGCRCTRLLHRSCLGSGLLCFRLSLPRCGCSGFRLHPLVGLTDPGQAVLSPPQFARQLTAAIALAVMAILLGIQDLGLVHQGVDLLLQLLLSVEHPLVARGRMLPGIGLHLGPVQRHMAQAHHVGLLAQPQDLSQQILEGVKLASAELADPAEVRLLVAGQHAKFQVLVASPLDPSGGDDAYAKGVEQQQRQALRGRLRLHPRDKTLLPTRILALGRDRDRGKIQLINQIEQERHLVVFRESRPGR